MPSPPVPVCLAGDAFSKTEDAGIMTTENLGSSADQRCAFATHTSPAPAACPRSPPPVGRAPNRSSKRHRKMISMCGRNLQQALQLADGTTPPRPPPPCTLHARANHVLSTSRGRQISTAAHLSFLDFMGTAKKAHANSTAAECRGPLPPHECTTALSPCIGSSQGQGPPATRR